MIINLEPGTIVYRKGYYFLLLRVQKVPDGYTAWITANHLDDIKKVKLDINTLEIKAHVDMNHKDGSHKYIHELNNEIKQLFPEEFI